MDKSDCGFSRISKFQYHVWLDIIVVIPIAAFIAMVLSLLSVSFRRYLKNWRYFGVKILGTGWDIMGLDEQNKVLPIDTKVLFYT